MAIGSEGWFKHCQSIEHTSECCLLVPAYPNSMEAGSQGRIKSQWRPGSPLVPPPQKQVQMAYLMTTALSLIVSKVTASLGKPVVFRTSTVHAQGHTLSASVIRCEMQSQPIQSKLSIIQKACSPKLLVRVLLISDCSCRSSLSSATTVSNYRSSASIVTGFL